MKTQLEYSWAVPEDLAAIEAFLAATYGPDSLQAFPGRCRWLYFENPLGLHISTCRSKGHLVAVCGHLPQGIRVGQEIILAGFGVDFMVAKEWRRCGIGRTLLEMRLERFGLSLSTGQSPDMGALYQSLGAVDLGPFYLGIHRNRPSISGNPKVLVRKNLSWIKGLGGVRPPANWSWQPCDVSRAASFTQHPEWFVWRYGSQPYGDYSCWAVDSGPVPSVVVSRKVGDHDLIVDFYTAGTTGAALLAGASIQTIGVETRIVFCGLRNHEECTKAGFWVRPQNTRLIAMAKDPHLQANLQRGAIEITSGASDADLLRFPESI